MYILLFGVVFGWWFVLDFQFRIRCNPPLRCDAKHIICACMITNGRSSLSAKHLSQPLPLPFPYSLPTPFACCTYSVYIRYSDNVIIRRSKMNDDKQAETRLIDVVHCTASVYGVYVVHKQIAFCIYIYPCGRGSNCEVCRCRYTMIFARRLMSMLIFATRNHWLSVFEYVVYAAWWAVRLHTTWTR